MQVCRNVPAYNDYPGQALQRMQHAPVFNIDLPTFQANPYPILEIMRRTAPVAWVPQLDAILITRHVDITACEKRVEVFSSEQPAGLMTRLMGHNMMRKDGEAHQHERNIIKPGLSPKTVRHEWTRIFQNHVDKLLDSLAKRRQAELVSELAMPLSAEALKSLTGLTRVEASAIDHWSQSMIDGISNFTGDPEVEAQCQQATSAIDAAIDAHLADLKQLADYSLLALMQQAEQPLDNIRANIKLAISGGQNEPRDVIAGAVHALLTHPVQLASILAGECTWRQAFDEYVRWISPIGMSPRRIAQEYTLDNVLLEPEDKVFFMFSSANRDETVFDNPDAFEITRNTRAHIAFGVGPHFCIGAAASRALIADVALPSIFNRFPDLAIDPSQPIREEGWAFRGLLNLPVTW